jgi:hypothetical protein
VIRFECSCGKRLKVEDRFAGETVECTACGKRMRVPATAAVPVAEVVEEPEAAPAASNDPLAALAQAAKGSGGAKTGSKTPVRPGAPAARGAKPAAKAAPGKACATAELLAKRRAVAPDNKKVLFVTIGVAAAIILVFVVYLAMQSDDTPAPTGGDGKIHYVVTQPPKTATRASSPGELFPSVAPQTNDDAPAKPEGGK